MKTIGLYEAKSKFSALVKEVEATGESIHLTRHGKIVAELTPPSPVITPKRGCLKSKNFQMSEDFDDSEIGFEEFFNDLRPDPAKTTQVNIVAENTQNYTSPSPDTSPKA